MRTGLRWRFTRHAIAEWQASELAPCIGTESWHCLHTSCHSAMTRHSATTRHRVTTRHSAMTRHSDMTRHTIPPCSKCHSEILNEHETIKKNQKSILDIGSSRKHYVDFESDVRLASSLQNQSVQNNIFVDRLCTYGLI